MQSNFLDSRRNRENVLYADWWILQPRCDSLHGKCVALVIQVQVLPIWYSCYNPLLTPLTFSRFAHRTFDLAFALNENRNDIVCVTS